jgi:hypothetical protein
MGATESRQEANNGDLLSLLPDNEWLNQLKNCMPTKEAPSDIVKESHHDGQTHYALTGTCVHAASAKKSPLHYLNFKELAGSPVPTIRTTYVANDEETAEDLRKVRAFLRERSSDDQKRDFAIFLASMHYARR